MIEIEKCDYPFKLTPNPGKMVDDLLLSFFVDIIIVR